MTRTGRAVVYSEPDVLFEVREYPVHGQLVGKGFEKAGRSVLRAAIVS